MLKFEGKRFSLPLGKRTYVMGILNVTPDSFSDGGLYTDAQDAIAHAQQMQTDGADILDIGAESTRPGHVPLTAEAEIERLRPVLRTLCETLQIPVSVDTVHPETAEWALSEGAAILNDVSGVWQDGMAAAVRRHEAGWILTHGANADAAGGNPAAVAAFFDDMLVRCAAYGIPKTQICLDPGIGFGKSRAADFAVLRELKRLKRDCALLVGASRKRLIGEVSGEADPQKRLAGTVACHTAAIAGGADLVRVHDVFEGVQGARVADVLYRTEPAAKPGKIALHDLRVFAYHGVNPEEKQYGQSFFIDVEMTVDFAAAVCADDIDNTVSYAKVAKTLTRVLTAQRFDLIEKAADAAADAVLLEYPAVQHVRLLLKKPDAPMKAQCAYASVEIEKERYI